MVEEGRRFAATADMKISDMGANAPVGSTLALLERQLKVMTAVQARVHFTLKQELQLLAAIIRDYTDDTYSYEPDGAVGARAKKSDYRHVDIMPVSDPNAATLSQRVVQYQAVIQLAQSAPDIYDLPKLHRGMLEVLGIKNADKLVPLEEDLKPTDPVSENQDVLKGKPVKAFQYQDHEAHIQVHMSAMQDPIVMQLVGQNPRAPMIQAAMMAHIAEHVGFGYRQKIEQQLGMPLPPEGEKLPPQAEIALSGMMAQAAQRVLQTNQAQAAQQQAQQMAQDPVVQMQQQELAIRQQEVQIKQQKAQADAAAKQQELMLKAQEVASRQGENPEVAAAKARQEMQTAAMRAQQELQTNAMRQAQELEAQRARLEMSAQEHQMKLAQTAQAHQQALRLKEQQRNQPPKGNKNQ